ncbi:MspA family porin [Rhodococcus sp. NPDC057297]|uniref:MspA family porin n=1 Tax=Rhodococcus sp. NPDC057297 TaxID=3346090 RepID=UPI00362757DF
MSAVAVAGASVVGLVLGTGTASAAVDSSNTIVDGNGNTIVVTLSDTFINGVPSLDGNPLTREWFANGRASWDVTGPDADDFEGTVKIGYQVGYPLSIGGGIDISWGTPSITANAGINAGVGSTQGTTTGPDEEGELVTVPGASTESTNGATAGINAEAQLIPTADFSLGIANGPGVVEAEGAVLVIDESAPVSGTEGDAAGASGSIQLANVHGTVTGVLGNVRVRPYVSVTSSTGDVAVTYGAPVTFN